MINTTVASLSNGRDKKYPCPYSQFNFLRNAMLAALLSLLLRR